MKKMFCLLLLIFLINCDDQNDKNNFKGDPTIQEEGDTNDVGQEDFVEEGEGQIITEEIDEEEIDTNNIIVIEEEQLEMKFIANYDSYFFKTGNKKGLFGLITKEEFPYFEQTQIPIVDNEDKELNLEDFFIKDEYLYITILDKVEVGAEGKETKTYLYFKQKVGTEEIKSCKTIPDKPILERSTMQDNGEFYIDTFIYKEKEYSDVRNTKLGSGIDRYKMIDGFYFVPSKGLFYNASEGRDGAREPGLYFWSVTTCLTGKINSVGEIWNSK